MQRNEHLKVKRMLVSLFWPLLHHLGVKYFLLTNINLLILLEISILGDRNHSEIYLVLI